MEKNKTYYIVDDDIDDQRFLIEVLTEKHESVQFVTAMNGEEAIASLKSNPSLPDIIFMDLNMPRMNGKECLEILKKTPSLQHIPVIIYSTTTNEKEIDATMQLGASYFLTKQNNYRELRNALSAIAILQ